MGGRLSFLSAIIFLISNLVFAEDGPIVNTAVGQIRGVRSDDGTYNMFMGIPYAKVDEENPFGTSTPYPPFDDVFEANDDSSICPQIEEFNMTAAGEIDCLRLNVYVPTTVTPNTRLPVMFWIYGGGFSAGFYGRYMFGPKYLVRDDVILVTINYRLGVYGFMCLDIPEVPGNQGLRDQILALRWVQTHISAFGGDPNQVTAFGNSAGAMSIDFHLLRPNNDEVLIHKMILQSGHSYTMTLQQPIRNIPIVLAILLGHRTTDIHDALRFLATVPPADLINTVSTYRMGFSPCIEREFDGVEPYLISQWIDVTMPAVKDMPIMIGVTDDELWAVRQHGMNVPGIFSGMVNGRFDSRHPDFAGMADLVEQFYKGDEEIGDATLDDVIDFMSDVTFVYPAHRGVGRYLENDAGNIYYFVFDYVGGRNFVQFNTNADVEGGGAAHADEQGYLFDMGNMPDEPTSDDQIVIDKMTKMWTNFAKYGDPTPQTTDLLDVKWEPVTKDSPFYCLMINKEPSLITTPFRERMIFWDLFYETNGHLETALVTEPDDV